MPGAVASAEPVRPAHFLDHHFADMSVGGWRAPPPPTAPPIPSPVPFTGVNMPSPPPATYGAAPAPYPVYPFAVGSDVPTDVNNQQSGQTARHRQNDCCFYCHRPVITRRSVPSASAELKELQPQSQVREPIYVFRWGVMRAPACWIQGATTPCCPVGWYLTHRWHSPIYAFMQPTGPPWAR